MTEPANYDSIPSWARSFDSGEYASAEDYSPRQVYQSLLDRLTEFRRHVRGQLLLEGAARLITAVILLAFATFALDRLFRLSLPARISMVAGAVVALGVVLWREIISPMRLKLDPLTLAAALDRMSGRGDGFITSRVGTVLDLPTVLSQPVGASVAMLHRAASECHTALAEIDFDARLDDRRRNLSGLIILAMILLPLLVAVSAPRTTRLWAARVLGGSNEPWPQKTYLQAAGMRDGVIVVPRGEPFVLRVSAVDGSVVPEVVTARYHQGQASRVEANFVSFGRNDFRYEFPAINAATVVEVEGGDAVLGPFTLRPADRPRVNDLQLIARHPLDKQPTTYNFDGESDVSFLPRTSIRLLFSSNTPVAEAHLKSSTTRPSQGDLRQLDDTHFEMDWTHNAAVNLEIELVSRDARLESAPTTVAVGLKVDQPPRVTIGYSGVKLRVTAKAKIPLTIDAKDDYGIASATMITKTDAPDPANVSHLISSTITTPLYGPVNPTSETEIQPRENLELEPLKLPVGTIVTVTGSATDACYIGPQTTASRSVTFRVVAPEELFREILLRQQAERAKFRKQQDEVRSMREQMNLTSTQEQVAALGRRQRALQHEVARISTSLTESLTEMKLNQLGTDEAYELMQKNVLTPLQQLNDQLLNPQKEALDNLSATDAAGLSAVETRQDRTFDQMTQILHQMSQWDSFVDVLNQLNEIIKMQDQAEQKTRELKKKETEGIFDK
jgi:hypothetical protein